MVDFDIGLEVENIDLKDDRLNKRTKALLKALEKDPSLSIPSACNSAAEAKAAYRFLNNPKVTEKAILASHTSETIKRCQKENVVLYIQDTTEFDFTDNHKYQKLNRLDHESRRGFYGQISLAITEQGVPLGVLGASYFDRSLKPFHKERDYYNTPVEEKESFRWVEGLRNASLLAQECSESQIVYVADRESDTVDFLFESSIEETLCDIVIRSKHDRNTTEKISKKPKRYKKILEKLKESPVREEITFKTQGGHGKKSRTVIQTVRSQQLDIKFRRGKFSSIQVNGILLQEKDPPPGEAPVDWLILTTLSIEHIDDLNRAIFIYLKRWRIEVFFNVLKTYCKVEDLKLIEDSSLKKCISIYMIISWRILLILYLARVYPDHPCSTVFADLEWKVVCLSQLKKQKKPLVAPKEPPKLKDFILMLASEGGFLGRKSDGAPGCKAICQGYAKMHGMVEGWELCMSSRTCG
jgi:IS4 transposase